MYCSNLIMNFWNLFKAPLFNILHQQIRLYFNSFCLTTDVLISIDYVLYFIESFLFNQSLGFLRSITAFINSVENALIFLHQLVRSSSSRFSIPFFLNFSMPLFLVFVVFSNLFKIWLRTLLAVHQRQSLAMEKIL